MRALSLATLALALTVACDNGGGGTDSGPPPNDAPTPMLDAPMAMEDAPMAMADAPAALATCADYCAAIMGACTGANAQYSSMAACMGSCAAFPVGTAGQVTMNTLQCRAYHTTAAVGDPGLHCVHAGPGGGGTAFCGTNCEGFCAIAASACTGGNEQWADTAACMTDCAMFPDTEPYDTSDTGGDSLACRLYHLTVASEGMMSANTHCDHIALVSTTCN
jgi:hypothetical protein